MPCSQGPRLWLDAGSGSVNFMTVVTPPGLYYQAGYIIHGTDLDNYPGNLVITAPAGIEVSLNNSTGFSNSINVPITSATLDHTQIYLRIPASVTGHIVDSIYHVGGGTSGYKHINGTVIDTEPTIQTSNIALSNFTDNTMDINWTNGNGSSRIVIVRESSIVDNQSPGDGQVYTANTDYGLAGELNASIPGNKIVFSGTGSGTITVSGLLPGTNYSVYAFEYNGSNGTNNYYSSSFSNIANGNTTGSPALLLQRNFISYSAPRFMASGSSNKIPTMFPAQLNNLLPNTTYRYYTQAALKSEFSTYTTGAADPVLIDYTILSPTFKYTDNPSLTTAGGYGKFTSNNLGSFYGYFGFVHNGDARFNAGDSIYPAIALAAEGAPGVERRYALSQSIKILAFANTAGANNGTLIQGKSNATAGSILFLYDYWECACGRPFSGSLVEGPSFIQNNGGASWGNNFTGNYDYAAGAWNAIIPNDNPSGVQLIQSIKLSNVWPNINPSNCDRNGNGIWPTGPISTINPTGGTTPLQISILDAPLTLGLSGSCFSIIPVKLSSFNVQKINNIVKLSWITEQELNSKEFVIERSVNATSWTSIATVAAAGNSNTRLNYSTIDNSPVKGINFYRIRQVDLDNRFDLSATKSVLFNSASEVLVTPNPAKDIVNVYIADNKKPVSILLLDASGKLVRKLSTDQQQLQINVSALGRGVYYVKVVDEGNVKTTKIILQ